MFNAFYDISRFKYIHSDLINSGIISKHTNISLIPRVAIFENNNLNVYIDTSDGVNEDLKIQEYCGRIKRIVTDLKGKPFLFFKSAYSKNWSQNIEKIAKENNGKVIPFFKWSFNENFYSYVFGNKNQLIEKNKYQKKIYDIGIFFGDKKYNYPKPSSFDKLISWSDHNKFKLPGYSENTGYYENNSRINLINKLKKSKFKILHNSMSYLDYIEASFQCKIIINPPGVGEYTSRMVDQTYLGNCIVLRKNSYDNGHSWKNHLSEVDFTSSHWENKIKHIIDNYLEYQRKSEEYYEKFWTSEKIVDYFKKNIMENI